MELRKIREIVAQQREEVHRMNVLNWCDRMEEQFLELDSPLAQIVIGVRRSGKSTLCHKFLKQHNITYAYINFDDERLVNFHTEDFDRLLEALTIVYGDFEYSCSHVEKPSDIVAQVSFYGKYTDYKPTPAKCFSEIIYLPFEDRKIPFPKDTDTVLKAYYGKNYMKPVMDSSVHGELILDTKKDYKQVQSELKNNTYKIVNL